MRKRIKNFFRKHWLILSIITILLAWLCYSYFSEGLIFSLMSNDVSKTLSFIDSFGIFAGVIFVILVIIEVVLAPIPPLVLYLIAGILFGGFLGGILTLVGNSIGALIDFKLARKYGQKKIASKLDKRVKKKFDKFFEKYGGVSIFILRVNPLTTSDIVSYLSGLTKIKTLKFMIATGLGLIPMIFIQTYLGDVLIRDSPILFAITMVFSVLYLIIFVYLIVLAIKKKN